MSIKKLKTYAIKTNSYKATKICFFLQKNKIVTPWIKQELRQGRIFRYIDLLHVTERHLCIVEEKGGKSNYGYIENITKTANL